jgi:outer membrane protein
MYKIKFILLILLVFCICSKTVLYAEEAKHLKLSLASGLVIALENFAAVQKSSENLISAELGSQSAKADFLPTIKANYNFTALAEEPYMVQNSRQVQVAHQNQYGWGITLSQPLFTGFALLTNYEMSQLNVQIKKKEIARTRLDIIKGVKSAYYKLLLAKKTLEVANDSVEYLKSHEQDALEFFNRGLTRRNDWLRAQVFLAHAVQNQEQAKAGLQLAVSGLNLWLAYDLNHPTEIEDIVSVTEKGYLLDELVTQGFQKRPVLGIMYLTLEVLEKAVKLEKSEYYPQVAVIASYERDGDSLGAEDNDYSNDYNALVCVQANWTLFDFSKRRARVARANADKRAFEKQIELTEDQIRLEIKGAYLNYNVAANNIKTSQASLESAKENLRITSLGYQQQVATSTEVLDARADLTQAQSNYYQSLYGFLDAVARLDRSIGKEFLI